MQIQHSSQFMIARQPRQVGQHLRLRGRSPPIIFARIVRPMNALQLCRWQFLAKVNSCSCSLYVVVRPSVCLSSVVCNVRAPYSGYRNFRQCFYAICYRGHLRPFGKNFMEIVPGEPLRRGVKPKRVEKCSDFGLFEATSRKRCKIEGK